jgi:hypothetical protein
VVVVVVVVAAATPNYLRQASQNLGIWKWEWDLIKHDRMTISAHTPLQLFRGSGFEERVKG